MILPYKLRTGLNSIRDEKVDKKSDRGGSREQFWPGLRSVRGFWSQVFLGRSLPRKSKHIGEIGGNRPIEGNRPIKGLLRTY